MRRLEFHALLLQLLLDDLVLPLSLPFLVCQATTTAVHLDTQLTAQA